MIVVKIMGGHSNQLFQYAAGRRLAHKHNTNVVLDLSWFDNIAPEDTERVYELEEYNLRATLIKKTPSTIVEEPLPSYSRITNLFKTNKPLFRIKEVGDFMPSVLHAGNFSYLDGYWQSEKYFSDITNIILEDLTYISPLSSANKKILDKIESTNSVSLHVRRGDYVSNKHALAFHGLVGIDYYKKAVNEIKKRTNAKELQLFVFSNDIEWCKQNLKLDFPTFFVEANKKGSDDMRLMRHCQHNILANSSFSWWGAWLNQNPSKIVIAPNSWFVEKKNEHMLPEKWIKL
jgi:hypothetical protein